MSAWVHVPTRQELLQAEKTYERNLLDWLHKGFPDLCRYGTPHPAAVAAVVRLHGCHGKGSLTYREHGPTIRAAVARWNDRLATDRRLEREQLEVSDG